ncbi:MAG: ABC transporter ATP-binding protein [Treponema sp.]|nr:ABC transporter ATP-binding protein [Treponema sp.]
MLELRSIKINYGVIQVIKDINITINKGQIVTIIGSNGAGKSTLIKGISGMVPLAGGEIYFQDKKITHLHPHEIVKNGIICAPEGRRIFPEMTVEENLDIGAYARIKDKGTAEKIKKHVFELFPVLKNRSKQLGGTLSGGEQQMLSIGRAVMADPKLLLLDEPSLGLAPIIVQEVFDIIKQLNREGVTILLVEQNAFQSLQIASRAYVLEIGRIKLEGTTQEMMENEDVKSSYLGVKINK